MHPLTREEALDILRHALPGELARMRGRAEADFAATELSAETRIGEPPVAADSLDRLNLAGDLNERFRLHETGAEDRLLRLRQLGEIAELIARATGHTSGMVFHSSGTTGTPEAHTHSWQALRQEAMWLSNLFTGRLRVRAWLPPHHLYGFMFGVALPRLSALPVQRGEAAAGSCLRAQPGDLIATVPERWRYLLRSVGRFPRNLVGVSSGAPLDTDLREQLLGAGLADLVEIYGSTETGAVGIRQGNEEAYQLIGYWRREDDDHVRRLDHGHGDGPVLLPDHVDWQGVRFLPLERRDGRVQIGGVNVDPEAVAERLQTLPEVAECSVRPFQTASGTRLKAFVVPADQAAGHPESIEARIREILPPEQRPSRVDFGTQLPRNVMGKPTDWGHAS